MYFGQEPRWDLAVTKRPSKLSEKFAFDGDPPPMLDGEGNYPMAVPGSYKPY
jgi:hypothetical protein